MASTSLSFVGDDNAGQTTEIEFTGGRVYQYFGVPAPVHDALLPAAGLGSSFSATIRSVYRFARMR